MFKLSKIASASLLLCASWAAHSLNLQQAYQEALANDPTYASAKLAYLAAQEKMPQARAGLLPTVAFTGNWTYALNKTSTETNSTDESFSQRGATNSPVTLVSPASVSTYSDTITNVYNGSGTSTGALSRSFALSFNQPIFRYANWQLYEQSKLVVMQAEAQYEQVRMDLMTRTTVAYFDVLNSKDNIVFLAAQKAAISEQLASAKRNFEVGTATITDTHEAQAKYDLVVAQEIAAQNDQLVKEAALQAIIGKRPENLIGLVDGKIVIASPQPTVLEDWVGRAETESYSVVAQNIGVDIARRQIKINRAGHMPTVDLVANRGLTRSNSNGTNTTYTTSNVSSSGQNFVAGTSTSSSSASSVFDPQTTSTYQSANSTSIGLQFAIPLFSGFAVNSRVREAIALEAKAESDLELTKRVAAQNARQYYYGVVSGLSQIKALEAAEVSSLSALESNKLGYQVGVRINIDVLNAQQQLFSTRKDLAKARYDALVNGLRLKNAAGALKEEDVQAVNALLKN